MLPDFGNKLPVRTVLNYNRFLDIRQSARREAHIHDRAANASHVPAKVQVTDDLRLGLHALIFSGFLAVLRFLFKNKCLRGKASLGIDGDQSFCLQKQTGLPCSRLP
jgi:hypothetical protein